MRTIWIAIFSVVLASMFASDLLVFRSDLASNCGAADQNPTLKLFLDRQLADSSCMQGYLLAQLSTESQPRVICYVLERSYKGNAPDVSSIPAGTYPLFARKDEKKTWRLQLSDVPNRVAVQIHIGNTTDQSRGCILPGLQMVTSECRVVDSGAAMKLIETEFVLFGESKNTTLTIRDVGRER